MKNYIKTISKVSLALTVAVALVASAAGDVFAQAHNPRDPVTKQAVLPQYMGAKVCRVDNSTTSKQCATGAGVLYGVCAYGTAAVVGKGSVAFDTITAANIADFGSLLAISPIVYGTANTASTDASAWLPKCWFPQMPVRFEGGLTMKQDDAGHDTLGYYRLDSGVNP